MRSAKSNTAQDQSKATLACFVFEKKPEGELLAPKRTLVTQADGRKSKGKENRYSHLQQLAGDILVDNIASPLLTCVVTPKGLLLATVRKQKFVRPYHHKMGAIRLPFCCHVCYLSTFSCM